MTLGWTFKFKGLGPEPRAGHFRGTVILLSDLAGFCASRMIGVLQLEDTMALTLY